MKKSEKVIRGKGVRFFKKYLSLFAIFLLAAVFFSCKSAPVGNGVKVHAFDTLEQDSNVYIRIPVKVHTQLTNNLLRTVIGGEVSDKHLKNITDNIDAIYIGSGAQSKRNRLQVACDGTVSSAAKLALTSMDNWKKEVKNGVHQVYTESNSRIQLCVPGSNLVCLSRDIAPQLALYDKEASAQLLLADSEESQNNADWKNSEIYNFVGNATTDNVRLYMRNPIAFVTSLLGVSLSTSIFQLNYLEGDIKLLPSGKYSIDLELEFSKNNLVAKASGILTLALLLTDSTVSVIDENHLKVTGIQVSMTQLQKILGLN